MALDGTLGLALGAIGLGVVHGVEPGHGWPVAASYALDRPNKWLAGLAASTVLGVGHLTSSIAMVLAFFWAKDYFGLTQIGWMSYVAGLLLILLGLREYRLYRRGGHSHDHAHDGSHAHDDGQAHEHGHTHGHFQEHGGGVVGRLVSLLPGDLLPDETDPAAASDRGILGIAAFAFALGFAHEEEFEIIALCAGSRYCLELMLVYALTVVAAIVGFTLLLIAGYEHHEDRVEAYAGYLPLLSAVVLVTIGIGFLLQVF